MTAQADQSGIGPILEPMNAGQFRFLAIAIAAALQSSTTRTDVLGNDRHRVVTDVRAVVMPAARRGGLSLPAMGSFFGEDHSSVVYAQNKVANNSRLYAVCSRFVDQLSDHDEAQTKS